MKKVMALDNLQTLQEIADSLHLEVEVVFRPINVPRVTWPSGFSFDLDGSYYYIVENGYSKIVLKEHLPLHLGEEQ